MWEPLFSLFFRHWPDCPYPVYLVANHQRCEHPRVQTLLAGDDKDWTSTLCAAIAQVPHSRVLFWIDDAFPDKPVVTQRVESLVEDFNSAGMKFLRLRPDPRPSQWTPQGYGILDKVAAYRVTLFATLWERDTLQAILRPGESAWQFEIDGTERSRDLDGFFATGEAVFSYQHGVERGIWIRPTAHALERQGFALDYTRRPLMTPGQHLAYRFRQLKARVFHLIPERHRMGALALVRRAYRMLGLRQAGTP
ncbi:MAG: hypothetical protein AB7O72_02320 [Ramlibacter sp.]